MTGLSWFLFRKVWAPWLGPRVPIAAVASIFTQESTPDPGGGWTGVLRDFGVALPFALLCLYLVRELWSENKRLLGLLLEATPALAESNKALAENSQTLATVGVLLHSVAGQPKMDPTELAIVKRLLQEYIQKAGPT